ncbi:MAG: HAD-IA family hydrolase [Burkholderiales bacterium]|nr:HAD-IA family hydrolase [Burkholderiales bacterium]
MPGSATARRLPVSAVLFDLDGTLADSAGDLALALNRLRADHGLPPVPVAGLRAYASSGARGLLDAGMGVTTDHAEYASLRDAFLAHYAQCLAETTRLFAGVEALLSTIEQRGLSWGIVTNKHSRFTLPVVAALGLTQRAAVVVSGDTTPNPKPHPAPLLHAAKVLHALPAACVYVGDDLRDIEAGQAAGMTTIVAGYGYMGNSGAPGAWPATGWIRQPLELLSWLPES